MSDSMEISQSDVSCEGAVDASKTFFDLDQYVNRSDMELLSNFNEMVVFSLWRVHFSVS